MSEQSDIKNLIFKQTLFIPVARNDLLNTVLNQLNLILPPITYDVPSWNYNETKNWIEFTMNTECSYIRHKLGFQRGNYTKFQKLRREFYKNTERILKDLPSIISNGYLWKITVHLLEETKSGCVTRLICYPFLYINKTTFKKTKVNKEEEQIALIFFHDNLQKLIIGLNAKEKSDYDLNTTSSFLGINRSWMQATLALQLQEVSLILVAKKKGIILDKPSVERILNRQIQKDEPFFSCQYEAFAIEAKRRYNIDLPNMPKWLRKMRQEILHEGIIPTEEEQENAVSATVSLLEKLEKIVEISEKTL